MSAKSRRPNILLISSDQQHWNTLGCLNPEIKTPHLDALAQRGMLFERAYCPNPTCTPTRASMITGKYPSQHGGWCIGAKLPEYEPTVGDVLGRAGYRTALIGKAHFQPLANTPEYPSLEAEGVLQNFDFWRDFHGPFYGFEHVELARNHTAENFVGQHYVLWMEEKGFANWRDYFRTPTGNNDDQVRTWDIPEEFHYDTWIAERTNAILEQYAGRGENFFLWSSFFDPHPQYLAPKPWDTMYDPDKLTLPPVNPGEHDSNPPIFQLTQQEAPDFSAWENEPGGSWCHGLGSHLHDRAELAKDIAVYYGMVSLMDKYIGKIMQKLDELGLRENTLVAFTSDHGHCAGHHGMVSKGPWHYEDLLKVPLIVSMPGRVPEGVRSDALQSLVDLPQSFLSICGLDVPPDMTGVDERRVWCGEAASARDHVIVENRHQPTTIHQKTYVNERYKLTVHWRRDYGELFDLQEDPGEIRNRWADPAYAKLKAELFEKLLLGEMAKEETLTEEALQRSNKCAEMYIKTFANERYEITVDPASGRLGLSDLSNDAGRTANLWNDPASSTVRAGMVRELLFARMGNEPLWMPRVHAA